MKKVRGLITLAALVALAALVGAAGPDKPKGKADTATSSTLVEPGFFRGR